MDRRRPPESTSPLFRQRKPDAAPIIGVTRARDKPFILEACDEPAQRRLTERNIIVEVAWPGALCPYFVESEERLEGAECQPASRGQSCRQHFVHGPVRRRQLDPGERAEVRVFHHRKGQRSHSRIAGPIASSS